MGTRHAVLIRTAMLECFVATMRQPKCQVVSFSLRKEVFAERNMNAKITWGVYRSYLNHKLRIVLNIILFLMLPYFLGIQ
jgi:hypothetical protein